MSALLARSICHLNLPPRQQHGRSGNDRHTIGLQQAGHTAGQLGYDLFFARHHAGHVEGNTLHTDTMIREMPRGLCVAVRAIQQCF